MSKMDHDGNLEVTDSKVRKLSIVGLNHSIELASTYDVDDFDFLEDKAIKILNKIKEIQI